MALDINKLKAGKRPVDPIDTIVDSVFDINDGHVETNVSGLNEDVNEDINDKSYLASLGKKIGAGVMNMIGNTASIADKVSNFYNNKYGGKLLTQADNLLSGREITRSIAPGLYGAGEFITQAGELLPDGYKNISDKASDLSQQLSEESDYYGGKDFKQLWNEGRPGAAAGEIFLSASESLPQSLVAMFGGPVGLVGTGVLAANQKYDELDENDPDMGETQKIINSVLTGSFEALSEKLGDVPIGKWLKSVYTKAGKEAAEDLMKKGFSSWLQKQFKDYGVLLAPVAEGTEEVASQIAENITDKLTSVDPERNITDGLLESFAYGAGGGAQFSAIGAVGLAKRQYNKIKTRRDLNTAREEYKAVFNGNDKMMGLLDELESASYEEKEAFINAIKDSKSYTEEEKKAINNLVQADIDYKSWRTPEALQEEKVERRELNIQTIMAQYDNAVAPLVAKNGMIQQVLLTDLSTEPVAIIEGDIATLELEGGKIGIDRENSSESLVYVDENGKRQIISPKFIYTLYNIENAADKRAQFEAQIRAQFDVQDQMRAQQRKAEEKQTIEAGDRVTYVDPDTGKQMEGNARIANPDEDTVTILLENGKEAVVPRDIVVKSTIQMTDPKTEEVLESNKMSENKLENEDSPSDGESKMSEITDISDVEEKESELSQTRIPIDESGNPVYHKADINDTIDDLLDGSMTIEEVDGFVDANISDVEKRLAKADKSAPKIGTNKSDYLAKKKAYESEKADLNQELEYWNEVKQQLQDARVKPGESEAINLMNNTMPQNGEELAAQMLANGSIKLLQNDYKREIGGGISESRSMFGLFASKEKGGVSIERAGEILMQADLENGTNFFDQNDPNAGRNAIIEVLSSARTRGDLIHYISNRRKELAEREKDAAYNEYARWCEENYHMTPEDYEAYEEDFRRQAMSVSDEAIDHINGQIADDMAAEREDYDEIYDILANKNNKDNESVERDDEGGASFSNERGDSLLQEEQPVQAEGATGVAEGHEKLDSGVRGEDAGAQEGASERIKPIGKGVFGNIYDQFRGKVKEAFDFLVKHKEGDLIGVFHRDEIGDIDLVWGEAKTKFTGHGLSHIIKKHIDTLRDFKDINELVQVVDDVVTNGSVNKDGNHYEINKDGYRVVIAENGNKKWVLTAFDNTKTKKEKSVSAVTSVTPNSNKESRAVAFDKNLSTNKGSESSSEWQTNEHNNSSKNNDDTVGGSPVALEYLLEGGQGSIENAGYFLHGVAAAFPSVTDAIEAIRQTMLQDGRLGESPLDFVAHDYPEIGNIRSVINNVYGAKGVELYNKLLANASGFVRREGKIVGRQIEELTPIDSHQEDAGAQEGASERIKPIGKGVFGNIYDQFRGKVKEAFDFLVKHKEGDLLGVFHRDGIGSIDLVWGNDNGGLKHIIKRHIEEQNDFSDVSEIQSAINDAISNGDIVRENEDKIVLQTDRYKVSINKQYRDENGNVIERKNWIVTAFDKTKKKGEKKNTPSRETLTTPSSNLNKADGVTLPSNGGISSDKDNVSSSEKQADGTNSSEAKDESNEFGERVRVEDAEFPKGLSEDVVVTKKQKGGKRRVSENISVAMVDGNLYIKRYGKGYARRNVSIRIPNAKQYGANEIVYRLELGVGTSTDAVRLMGDAILELYRKEGLRFEKSVGASDVSPEESVLRDALVEKLRESGMDVVTDSEEAQRVLDEANGIIKLSAKQKRALETASLSQREKDQPTVVSSADGAKILKNLDNLFNELEKKSNYPKTFIGELAEAIGAETKGSSSQYATFETINGQIVTIRLANHNASTKRMDDAGRYNAISIVISSKPNEGILNDGNAHVVEFYYDSIKLRRADGHPLAEIVRSIKQALYSGEYKDTTGLAEVKDVNSPRFFRTASGEAYGFTVDGKIYLDPRIAMAETPIHEYAHLWADALRAQNPQEWRNVVELMKGTPVWEEVKRLYPELKTDDEIADEVLAHYSGNRGAKRLRKAMKEATDSNKSSLEIANAVRSVEKVKEALHRFWKGIADWLGIHFTSAEEVADKVMADMLNGVNPVKHAKVNGNPRFQFVGEKGAANMDKAEEATTRLDNLSVAREMEQAFNEKKARIEKLRKSEPVVITGNEYEGKYELNRDSAKQWIKDSLRGEYFNNDTGEKIEIRKDGAQKVTSHSMGNEAHLKSIAVIPELIEKSIFIGEIPNEKNNGKYDSYRYYVCGLKIGEEDYTVKVTVGVKGNSKYYDHALTQIEKGTLIDNIDALSPTFDNNKNTSSEVKDTKLLSLLQMNEQENARKIKMATGWERGADGKWRYEVMDGAFDRNGELHPERRKLSAEEKKELDDAFDEIMEAFEKGSQAYKGEIDGNTDMADIYVAGGMERKRAERLARLEDKEEELSIRPKHLDDYIDNEELFAAYPELREVKVKEGDALAALVGRLGHYDPTTNTILLNDLSHDVLLHETQHVIQRIEGFARGGSMDTPELKDSEEYRQWKEMLEKMRSATEKEQELYSSLNYYIAESEKLEEQIDKFFFGEYDARKDTPVMDAMKKELEEMLSNIQSIMAEIESEQNNRGKKVQAMLDAEKSVLQRLYKRLAGEVEARNVQSRMGMTEEERRNSLAAETEDVAREDQIFLMENAGKADSLGDSASFKERQQRAVQERGVVPAGLNEALLNVEEVPMHPYKGHWTEARTAAVEDAYLKYSEEKEIDGKKVRNPKPLKYDNYGRIFTYTISKSSLKESVNPKQVEKSKQGGAPAGVHLAVLNHLDRVIANSIEIEEHPDYQKGEDGVRNPENGYNSDKLIHRFVGAVRIDGKEYLVKTTMHEHNRAEQGNRQYAYDLTKIEVLNTNVPSTSNGLTTATKGVLPLVKVLKNLEKAYDFGKKLLEESKKTENNALSDIKQSEASNADDDILFRYTKRGNVNMSANADNAIENGMTDAGLDLSFAKFINDNNLGSFDGEYHHVGKDFNKHYFVTLNEGVSLAKARRAYKEHLSTKADGEIANVMKEFPEAINEDEIKARGEKVFPDPNPTYREVAYAAGKRWYTPLPDSGTVGYRLRKTTKKDSENFDEVNQKFNKELQKQIDGTLPKDHVYQLGYPSEYLQAAGIPNLPIELRADKLATKSSEEYKSNHPFELGSVENLPKAIADPIAVFDSKTRSDVKVVLTELQSNGNNFVVAIQLNRKVGKVEINSVRSIYPKDYIKDIYSWLNDGLLKWADKQKATDFISNSSTPANVDNKNSSLSSATKIVESFVNPTLDEGKILSAVEELSESLNTPVHIIRDVNEIKGENKSLQRKKRGSKGWYDPKTDEVYIVLPNAENISDAQATIMHEIVAHKGLRGLLGDNFGAVMDSIFDSFPQEVQDKLKDEYGNKQIAAEEYCAEMAETMGDPGIIQKIAAAIRSALRKLGVDVKMEDGDILYLLWKSKNRLMDSDTAFDVMRKQRIEEHVRREANAFDVLFRGNKSIDSLNISDEKKERLRSQIQSKGELLHEAYVDRMVSVRKLQEEIARTTGKPIADYMDVWTYENTLPGRNAYEQDLFLTRFIDPLVKAIGDLTEKGYTRREIENYVIAKHGFERNEYMRYNTLLKAAEKLEDEKVRASVLSELQGNTFSQLQPLSDPKMEQLRLDLQDRDFSGLTGVYADMQGSKDFDKFKDDMKTNGKTLKDFMPELEKMVNDMEKAHPQLTATLWDKIAAANDFSLKKWFNSGMIDRETYNKIKGMYQHYVPLRGFDEAQMHDVFEYVSDKGESYDALLKKTAGRVSRPDDPFAHIASMGDSAIVGGNKNVMKQHLYRLATAGGSDKLTVKDQWYECSFDANGNEIWTPAYPVYDEDPDQYRKNIEDFEADMILKKAHNMASIKRGEITKELDEASKKNMEEHIVKVRINGREHLIYVNGNPKVAQVINGMHNVDASGTKMYQMASWWHRQMAANFTTRNPAFVLTNLSRDMIWASTTLAVKEGVSYDAKFLGNIKGAAQTLGRRLKAGKDWTPDPNNPMDVYLEEFLKNGAKTGYTALYNIDKHKHDIENALKSGRKAEARKKIKDVADKLSNFNEFAEDLTRFAVYVTSRKEGRSILRSVSDAKEVTVNFNRKGSGAMGNSFFRGMYLFFNAAVQSLYAASKIVVKNPKGAFALAGGSVAAGMIIPMLINMMGDDEDMERYMGLPDYVRKNNICIPLPGGSFFKIPLPIELRALYGIGDAFIRYWLNFDEGEDAIRQAALGLADLLPLNPVGESSGLIPSFISPFYESYWVNKDFTGKPIARITPFNEYDPEYQKVYKSTNVHLVRLSEYLNSLAGGNAAERSFETYKTHSGADLLNPASVEHLFEGYLGGAFTFINQTIKTAGAAIGVNEFNQRNMPILNRFFDNGEVDGTMMKVNEKYYDLLEDARKAKHSYNKYERLIDESPSIESARYMKLLQEFEGTDEWRRADYILQQEEEIKALTEEAKETTDSEYAEYLKTTIANLKKEMVKALRGGKVPA